MKSKRLMREYGGYSDAGLKVSKSIDKALHKVFEKWGAIYDVRELQLMLYTSVGFNGTMFALQKHRVKRRKKS